jgi:hypothetical protein
MEGIELPAALEWRGCTLNKLANGLLPPHFKMRGEWV